jgi:hypothetical protein
MGIIERILNPSKIKIGDRVKEAGSSGSLRTQQGRVTEIYHSKRYGQMAIVLWDGHDGGENLPVERLESL